MRNLSIIFVVDFFTEKFQKVKGKSCSEVTEWVLCWVFPACMYKNKRIVHKCPNCGLEIANLPC